MGSCASSDVDGKDTKEEEEETDEEDDDYEKPTRRQVASAKRRSLTGPSSRQRPKERIHKIKDDRERRKYRDSGEDTTIIDGSGRKEKKNRKKQRPSRRSKPDKKEETEREIHERRRLEAQARQAQEKAARRHAGDDEEEVTDDEESTDEWRGKRGSVRVRTKDRIQNGVTDYIKMEDLEIMYRVGVGEFGEVDCVRDKTNDRLYALKAISKGIYHDLKILPKLFYEKECLLRIQSRYVIHLYSTMQDSQLCYFCLELVDGGEFHHHLLYHTKFDVEWCQFYAANVVLAFEYMHSHKIVYRDMKPENLMLDGNGYVKIIDLGFAKILEHTNRTHTYCGTADYLAPEIIKSTDEPDDPGHDYAVDWWGVGVLIYEMLIGRPPFRGSDPEETFEKAISGKVRYPRYFKDKFSKKVVRAFLKQDPCERLGYMINGSVKKGVRHLKKHPWFAELDWIGLETQDVPAPYIPNTKDFEKNARAHDQGEKASFKKYRGEADDDFRGF